MKNVIVVYISLFSIHASTLFIPFLQSLHLVDQNLSNKLEKEEDAS